MQCDTMHSIDAWAGLKCRGLMMVSAVLMIVAMHLLIWNPQHKQKMARSNYLVHFFPFPHPKYYCYKNTRWELLAYYNLETLGEGVSLTTRNTKEADTGSTYHTGWDWFGCVINPLVLSSGKFSYFKYPGVPLTSSASLSLSLSSTIVWPFNPLLCPLACPLAWILYFSRCLKR